MSSKDWYEQDEESEDEIHSSLQQRTEELYQIPDTEPDEDGYIECPVVILKDIIVFPNMISPIYITQGDNLLAIQEAQYHYQTVIAIIQEASDDKKEGGEFLPIGVEIAVGRLLSIPDGNSSALVQGRRRVEIVDFVQTSPFIKVKAKIIESDDEVNTEIEALMRATRDLFQKCVQLDRSLPEEAYLFSMNINDPGWLADMVATAISVPFNERKVQLLTMDPIQRLKRVNSFLAQELDVLQLENEIQTKVQDEVDRTQREFYLREQLKAIQTELGEGDIWMRDITEIREKIEKANLPEEVQMRALKEAERLNQTSPMAPEVGIIRTYLDWIVELPWIETSEDNLDVAHAKKVLDEYHYGLQKAKDRVLEFIAVKKLSSKKNRQPILCFVGPPGTGKTSLGKSIAEALGRKFVRLSLGGVRDEAEIRGHRRTYIGAMPGRIIQTMKKVGTMNPLFMLDEIDKLGMDFRGDPSSALLEVLDPEQNFAFSDHYLEIPYDLSNVMFITTANSLGPIPPALLDRMEVIEFSSYIEEEKMEIARQFIIQKQKEDAGLEDEDIRIGNDALLKLILEYTYEAGVRNLEREIGSLFRKIARVKTEGKRYPKRITETLIEKLLGPPQINPMEAEKEDEIGVAMAMAWTESGGEIMPVEVLVLDGKGNMQITGQVGDVMQESAQAGLSYLKSRVRILNIDQEDFDQVDIHVHVPEGAIPKDGPSAGITIATALISAFTEQKVKKEVAMTGEITLRGKVLPVGGVKEKILAAHRAGLKTIILPEKNMKNLSELPKRVRSELEIISVKHMDEVLEHAFVTENKKKKATVKTRKNQEEKTEE